VRIAVSLFLSLVVSICVAFPHEALAGPEEGIFQAVKVIYESTDDMHETETRLSYQSVRKLLDRIVEEYPASDLAVRILLKDNIDGVDIAAIDEFLSTEPEKPAQVVEDPIVAAPAETPFDPAVEDESQGQTLQSLLTPNTVDEQPEAEAPIIEFTTPQFTEPAPEIAAAQPTASEVIPVATAATEDVLSLERQDIRDLQARLLVLGHDPNGIDGVIGPGTRSAIRAWQNSIETAPSGFVHTVQLVRLRQQSESALAVWRQNPDNERLYLPPPPIAIGPHNLSGIWRFTTNCGPNSRIGRTRIDGVMDIANQGGSSYAGRVRQSQGLIGRFSGRVSGRRMSAEVNWGLLLGRIQISGRIADHELTVSGRDSNRCSFFARKS